MRKLLRWILGIDNAAPAMSSLRAVERRMDVVEEDYAALRLTLDRQRGQLLTMSRALNRSIVEPDDDDDDDFEDLLAEKRAARG